MSWSKIMCDCLEKVEAQIKERLMDKVPEGSCISNNTFDGAGWANQVINFGSGQIEVMIKYTLVYRQVKKNKEFAKNLSRLETNVRISYCPFCGEKKAQDNNPRR